MPEATTPPAAARPRATRAGRFTLLYCAAALLLFAFLSYSAVSTKSATFDEPDHVCTSYVALRYGDFRVEPDHPPLWKYWAALPLVLLDPPINANTDTPVFRDIPSHFASVLPWCVATLYETPGNDPARILPPARFMMLLCGVALGAVVARFAYRAAGAVAACVAVTLFCLDPNFLAHAPLVKNDVAIALCATALAYALWRAGEAVTLPRLAAVALLCGACVTTKLTGLLAAPITVLALVARALLPDPWPVLGRTLATRGRRRLAAVAVCVACALVTYVAIWAVYRFRFNPAPDPTVHYDTSQFLAMADKAGPDSAGRAPSIRAALFALDHHLLPESFVEGLIFARAASTNRPAYALGELYRGGRWYYFPLAFLVKTPLATLAVLLFLPLATLLLRSPSSQCDARNPQSPWLWTCLLVPVVVFLGVSLPSSVNIGIRHIFPVFPPLYIGAGVLAARLYGLRPKVFRPALLTLSALLLVETLSAFPNYIPYFNAAAGGYRGGFYLLGDSNLDWGQDLPLLAEWQRRHPGRTLHLAYFGTADPAYYGLQYLPAPGTYPSFLVEPPKTLPTSGVLAVSASVLQGVSDPFATSRPYASFLHRRPTEILGGSIYLYDLGGN